MAKRTFGCDPKSLVLIQECQISTLGMKIILTNCVTIFRIVYPLGAGTDEQSTSASNEGEGDQEDTPFTDNYDIAASYFKNIVDEHVVNLTLTDKEITETERLTRGQSKNQLWFDKRKSVLTVSNFGKAVKTKVEPSNKLKAMLYANFVIEAVQYGIESEEKAVALYIKEMQQEGISVKVEVGLLLFQKKTFLGASLDRVINYKS